eukprot:9889187-Prorocentrum_lima.AAC.1
MLGLVVLVAINLEQCVPRQHHQGLSVICDLHLAVPSLPIFVQGEGSTHLDVLLQVPLCLAHLE